MIPKKISCRFSIEADNMVIELAKAHNTQRWIIYSLLAEYAIANQADFETKFSELSKKIITGKRPIAMLMKLTQTAKQTLEELAEKHSVPLARCAFYSVLYGLCNIDHFRRYIQNNPLSLL